MSAADRIHRVFGRFISAGYVFYLLFVVPTAVSQAHLTAWWWLPTSLLAIFGTGIALGVATFLSDVRWVGRLAAANALAFLIAAALWFLAWTGEASTSTAWQALFPGVAGLSAAAAWRPRTALAYLTVVVFVVQATNYLLVNTTTGYRFVPELAFALMFCGVFAAAAIVAFRTGDVLDSTVAATERSVVAAARTVERERFDALVHDQVMSTLLASGRGASDGPVAAQARRALEMFDSLRRGDDTESSFDADRVAAQFRSAASEVDEDVEFTTATSVDAGPHYPADVIRAVAAALAEAVRNSVRHAGPGTQRAVHVDLGSGSVRVVVRDDGHGFDPAQVDPYRMGIRASIHGRMRSLAGGDSQITSGPGGTTVTLFWRDPAERRAP
ncbi:ATP-binding protein [Rhodococcus rhodochrous]|uniref:ATP-binding protein n=1 Tax=Rhodococcus rhodochrous TaxID=1829 RepID=UPI0021BD3EF6|nr:ATP-binding protein [Rhodococcus rhodochrous]